MKILEKQGEKAMLKKLMMMAIMLAPVGAFAQAETGHALLPQGGSLGVQAGYYRYSENPKFMELESKKAGAITGAYQTQFEGWDTRLEGRFLYAPADYTSSQGHSKNETNYSVEGRVLLTHEADFPTFAVAPYMGLGYRALRNDGKDVNGYSGYTRISQYVYLPVGVWGGVPLQNGAMLLGQAEVGTLLVGQQYSDINSGIYNDQHSGEEVRLSAAYRAGPWQIGPYAQFWRVGNSSTDCSGNFCGYEPKNFTREVGLELTYHF